MPKETAMQLREEILSYILILKTLLTKDNDNKLKKQSLLQWLK